MKDINTYTITAKLNLYLDKFINKLDGSSTMISSGISKFDEYADLQSNTPSRILITGTYASGKSSLLLSLLKGYIDIGYNILYISNTLTCKNILTRLISQYTNIPIASILRCNLSPKEIEIISESCDFLYNANLHLFDCDLVSSENIVNLYNKFSYDIIMIDDASDEQLEVLLQKEIGTPIIYTYRICSNDILVTDVSNFLSDKFPNMNAVCWTSIKDDQKHCLEDDLVLQIHLRTPLNIKLFELTLNKNTLSATDRIYPIDFFNS